MRTAACAARAEGVCLRISGRFEESLAAFERGRRLAEDAGDALLAAQIPIAAIDALARLGRYAEAGQIAAELEERLTALGAREDAAKVQANRGNIHFQREELKEALACWERARAYFRAEGQDVPVARLEMNIANVLTHLNRTDEALRAYTDARDRLEAAGMEVLVAGIDGNIGYLELRRGHYQRALVALEAARERFARLDMAREAAGADRHVADAYRELNLLPEARDAYQRVRTQFAEVGARAEEARTLQGLAALAALTGNAAEALVYLDEAEALFRADENALGIAEVELSRSEALFHLGELERACRCAGRARRFFLKHGCPLPAAHGRLVMLEARGHLARVSVGPLRTLMAEVRRQSLLPLEWRVQAALARAEAAAGALRRARRRYYAAIASLEHLRELLPGEDYRIAFQSARVPVYEELLKLLLDEATQESIEAAFALAERSRARSLVELMEAGDVRARSRGPLFQHRERLARLRAELSVEYGSLGSTGSEEERLPNLSAQFSRRVRDLERQYGEARRQLQVHEGTFPAAEVSLPLRTLLGEGETLIEYAAVGDELLAFVVNRGAVRVVRPLGSLAEVRALAERLRFQWSKFRLGAGYAERHADRLLGSTQELLKSLHDQLIAPLLDLCKGRKLVIVPHGPVHSLPMHALWDGTRYLTEYWEIGTAPSAAILRRCRITGDFADAPVRLIGVPQAGIEHVADELRELSDLFPHAELFEGDAAGERSVPRDGRYRLLHLAAHAVFREDNPLFSGVRLADGWLLAADVEQRRLDCELVTLSACHTGVGAVAPGEEALGLTRSFLRAGARSVLVSLWGAHDAATALLMRGFYERLIAGHTRGEALNGARNEVRERYPHPYFWAPFTLVGAS